MTPTDLMGYYIGSFDPPTLAHRAAVVEAMRHFNLARVYITVNHRTDKDFNASIAERIGMLRLLFADQGDRVVILREPLEGRREFAHYVLSRYSDTHLLGIFGDDTFEKNFKIFAGEPRFDFVRIARPTTAECADTTYKPTIYDIILQDADGVSSSEARRRIALGLDTSDILSGEVSRFIAECGLYPHVPDEALAAAEYDFLARWTTFHASLEGVISEPLRTSLGLPCFKGTQSKQGQHDKFVRHVVEKLDMPLPEQFRLRPVMERLLGIGYASLPLTWRAGVYLGSFDPPADVQADVVAAALVQGALDRLTVGVLSSSRRPLQRSTAERLRLAREMFGKFGDRVRIVEGPSLEDAAAFLRQQRNEQLEPLLTVFGANVFPANYARLSSLDNLSFAVAPMDGVDMPDLPAGAIKLALPRSVAVE
ncbi:MAG: hypothetical protein K2W95_35180 [Candidatus Obscuribacterales bacterium]|nr:hypothetical protein [Candidatus Obscuribacterales bacterium]